MFSGVATKVAPRAAAWRINAEALCQLALDVGGRGELDDSGEWNGDERSVGHRQRHSVVRRFRARPLYGAATTDSAAGAIASSPR